MDIDLSRDAPVSRNLQEANEIIKALWSVLQNLSQKNEKLSDEYKVLKTEFSKLREAKKTNSKNSSLPPSKDKNSKNKSNIRRNALRKKNNKKRGGQPGHVKHARKLLPVDQVDHIVVCYPERYCFCGNTTELRSEYKRHQKYEFPVIKPIITEYQIYTRCCVSCNKIYTGKLPAGVSWSMLGPRATAMTAHLSGTYRISKKNIVGIYQDVFSFSISTGMICKAERVVSNSLEKPVDELKEYVQSEKSEVGVHADETGFKEQGKKMWAWVAVYTLVAVFIIRKGRTKNVAKELLGEFFSGILCSDRFGSYEWLPLNQRQLCWAHLERDFRKISERPGTSQLIGSALLLQTNKLFHHWHRFKESAHGREQLKRQTKPIRLKIEQYLQRGMLSKNTKTAGTCRHIFAHKKALWQFIEVEKIEPTNNVAERTLRTLVIWRKTSFGTQSPRGTLYMERIMSVVATCRLQGKNTLEYLTSAVKSYLNGDDYPSLVPLEIPTSVALAA